jgi:hypothetical protein
VRDGYVNFYMKGQSVAKLSCGRDGPKLSVHRAYVSGRKRGVPGDGVSLEQIYETFDAGALADPATANLITGWIETADTYASAEKRFVDDLVASNPGIIDLEMGLPASDEPDSERVAPRVDLVVVQTVDGQPSIAFWEAKCANNTELRSSKEYEVRDDGEISGPKVINQIRKYVAWLVEGDRISQVRAAYKATAAILVKTHRMFCSERRRNRPACDPIWQALSNANEPLVIVQPGVVIGNYWPEGYIERIASDRMRQSARSFAKNGHREKLQRNGISVYEVGSAGASLPRLPIADIHE